MMQFAVIGNPIEHSLSPLLHREIYRQLDIDASFEKIKIKLDSLSSFMIQNELDGFNVTVPYKQSVIPLLDELDESDESNESKYLITFSLYGIETPHPLIPNALMPVIVPSKSLVQKA